MPRLKLPEPIIRESVENEIRRLISKGLSANKWRPDFEDWAERRVWAERHQQGKIDTLVRFAGDFKGQRVLDLGAGRGGLSIALSMLGATVTTFDLRRRNCKIARLRASRYDRHIDTTCGYGDHLPFKAGSFDLVICKDVTEHVPDPQRLLAEIRRVIREGGRAYVTFINRLSWDDPHYHIKGINFLPRRIAEHIIALRGRDKENSRDFQRLSDMHYFTIWGARRLASRLGFVYQDVSRERAAQLSRLHAFAHSYLSVGRGTLEAVLRVPK